VDLGGYTWEQQKRTPLILTVILGCIWGYLIFQNFQLASDYPNPEASSIYLEYADREMRMLDGAADGPALMRWYFEVAEPEKVLESLALTFDTARDHRSLDHDEDLVRILTYWELGEKDPALRLARAAWEEDDVSRRIMKTIAGGEPVAESDVAELRQTVIEGEGRAWDARVLRLVEGEDHWGAYRSRSKGLAWRILVTDLAILAALILALLCVPLMMKNWKATGCPRPHRVTHPWTAPFVLGVFFGTDLIARFAFDFLVIGFGQTMDWWPVALGFDTLWRMLPVILVMVYLFNKPTHMFRVFGLDRRADWTMAFGMLALLWLIPWIAGLFMDMRSIPVDPTDFILYARPTFGEMVLVFFSSCVMAPISEEILFRGLLFMGLRKASGPWAALVLSSVLFGLMHWQYDLVGVLSVMVFGAGNALLVWRTGSLVPAILLHAIYNFLITLSVAVAYELPI